MRERQTDSNYKQTGFLTFLLSERWEGWVKAVQTDRQAGIQSDGKQMSNKQTDTGGVPHFLPMTASEQRLPNCTVFLFMV